jgi:hypothetical protein
VEKKMGEKTASAKNAEWKNVLGCVELRMANNRRDRAGANIAISEELISNALVKDHAALGVCNFQIPVRTRGCHIAVISTSGISG